MKKTAKKKVVKKSKVPPDCGKSKGKGYDNLVHNGRKKGSKNKYSADVKKMLLDALNERGGKDFFKKLDKNTFARVAAKLVPQTIDANLKGEVTQTVNVITSGKGKK